MLCTLLPPDEVPCSEVEVGGGLGEDSGAPSRRGDACHRCGGGSWLIAPRLPHPLVDRRGTGRRGRKRSFLAAAFFLPPAMYEAIQTVSLLPDAKRTTGTKLEQSRPSDTDLFGLDWSDDPVTSIIFLTDCND